MFWTRCLFCFPITFHSEKHSYWFGIPPTSRLILLLFLSWKASSSHGPSRIHYAGWIEYISIALSLLRLSGIIKSSRETHFQIKFCDELGVGMGPTREFISLFSKELQNRQYHFWNDSDDSPCLLVSSSSSSSSFPPPNLPSNIGFVICRCGEWVLKHCPTHRSLLCLDSVGAWKCSEGDFSVSSYDSICPNCGQSLQFCLQLRYNNATNMI